MKKRIFAVLLCVCLAAGLLPSASFAAGTDAGAGAGAGVDAGKAMQLGTGGISGYAATSSYDYIYFGDWKDQDSQTPFGPIKWRVLDTKTNMDGATEGDGLFLLSDTLLGTGSKFGDVWFQQYAHWDGKWGGSTVYHKGKEPDDGDHADCLIANAWQGSDGQSWCKNFYCANLTTGEQRAVLTTTKSDEAFSTTSGYTPYNIRFAASENILDEDKVFFLSGEEAENENYGFTDNAARIAYYGKYADVWWLRSHLVSDTDFAGAVIADGYVHIKGFATGDWSFYGYSARPAFNLDPNSILFTSVADNSGHIGFGTAIPDYSGSEWKTTLKDGKDFSSGASVSGATTLTEGYSDTTLTVSHAALSSLSSDYTNVTAALTDASGELLYYGSVNSSTSATESTVTIPAGLAEGTYTLSLYGEDWNDAKCTDYATGTPYTAEITVDAAPPAPSDEAKLYGATLTLDGTIGVNFYVDMTDVEEDDRASYRMEFTVAGGTRTAAFDESACRTLGDATCYRFTCPVYAKQMADGITAGLYNGDTLVKEVTYSAKKYCDNMLERDDAADGLGGLLRAMLNYGAAAQTHFVYNTGSLANAGLTEDEKAAVQAVTAEDFAGYAPVTAGALPGGLGVSASLLLESDVTIRFYVDGAADGCTFALDGNEVAPTECPGADGRCYVDVPNVGVRQLATAHTLAVGDGGGQAYSVSYSALSYAHAVVSDASEGKDLQDVAKALYLYFDASTGYHNWMKN